ncbi:MAG: hypothetical protein MZU79_04560 [Anaerotruncus sp.]|nr:hypothetical protein [Anaerotruncus sp.]
MPVVELGPRRRRSWPDLGKTAFDRDAALALGAEAGARRVLRRRGPGDQGQAPGRPARAAQRKTLFARADVRHRPSRSGSSPATNGATLWTRSATREGTVGSVGVGRRSSRCSPSRDKNEAMDELLREITYRLTWDFRPTRRRL